MSPKQYILLALCSLLYLTMHAQEKGRDSVIAIREAKKAQQQFSLSTQQTGQLTAAGIRAANARRRVFKQYWKTNAFLSELAKAEQLKDSLYEAALGPQKFRRFKETLRHEFEEKVNAQRATRKQPDSVTNKNSQNENQ